MPIYAIATYEPAILKQFGLAEGNTAYLGAVIIQIFYVFGSLSGALFINRGRRKLLLWSFAISALPLLGLAIIAHPPMWLVLVLFCVFGVAMYSGQCLEAIYPSELPHRRPRHRERIRHGRKQNRRSDRRLRCTAPARYLGAADDARRRWRGRTGLARHLSAGT